MKVAEIIAHLEIVAPPMMQESYDNAGLITGSASWECTGITVCLDSTPGVILEAISAGHNLVVAHHPIVFSGLKKINGNNYVEETVILAIKHDIAIYAIHTNLDNMMAGVNGRMADRIGLENRRVLAPKKGLLRKLHVFVPASYEAALMDALFAAGAGSIGNYSECSFSTEGKGSFKGSENTHPFVGQPGSRHTEEERRIEVVFPAFLVAAVLTAMRNAHPYEEIAYDLVTLDNEYQLTGSGLVGELPAEITETDFLRLLKSAFDLPLVRHTALRKTGVKTVALCGGAGSFLISKALAAKSDAFITADIKYHEFFDADNKMIICDIGHFESEQYTVDLLYDILREKFTNFAVLKTGIKTNPVHYFL